MTLNNYNQFYVKKKTPMLSTVSISRKLKAINIEQKDTISQLKKQVNLAQKLEHTGKKCRHEPDETIPSGYDAQKELLQNIIEQKFTPLMDAINRLELKQNNMDSTTQKGISQHTITRVVHEQIRPVIDVFW